MIPRHGALGTPASVLRVGSLQRMTKVWTKAKKSWPGKKIDGHFNDEKMNFHDFFVFLFFPKSSHDPRPTISDCPVNVAKRYTDSHSLWSKIKKITEKIAIQSFTFLLAGPGDSGEC